MPKERAAKNRTTPVPDKPVAKAPKAIKVKAEKPAKPAKVEKVEAPAKPARKPRSSPDTGINAGPAVLKAMEIIGEGRGSMVVLGTLLGLKPQNVHRAIKRAKDGVASPLPPRCIPALSSISGMTPHEIDGRGYMPGWKVPRTKIKQEKDGSWLVNGAALDRSQPLDLTAAASRA